MQSMRGIDESWMKLPKCREGEGSAKQKTLAGACSGFLVTSLMYPVFHFRPRVTLPLCLKPFRAFTVTVVTAISLNDIQWEDFSNQRDRQI